MTPFILQDKILDILDKHCISVRWVEPGKEEGEALTKEEFTGILINGLADFYN
jgi:hypothetical protein